MRAGDIAAFIFGAGRAVQAAQRCVVRIAAHRLPGLLLVALHRRQRLVVIYAAAARLIALLAQRVLQRLHIIARRALAQFRINRGHAYSFPPCTYSSMRLCADAAEASTLATRSVSASTRSCMLLVFC